MQNILSSALTALFVLSTISPAFSEETSQPHRQILAMAGYADSEKPKVITFRADWCPTCDQLEPAIEKAESRYGKDIDFVSVNIDDEKNRDIVRLYRVRGVPEVVFVNGRGRVVSTFMGNEPRELKIGLQKLLKDDTATSIAAKTSLVQ